MWTFTSSGASKLRRYYETTGRHQDVANAAWRNVKDSIKSVVTQRTLQQVITAERAEFTDAMMKPRVRSPNSSASNWDVRSPRLNLPQQVQDSVFDRMRATFKAQAAKLRPRREAAEKIPPKRTSRKPRFWPMRTQAAQTRGRAMHQRARCTPSRIPKTRSSTVFIEACSPTASDRHSGDMLVIAPDSAYFKYFNKPQPHSAALNP